VTLDSLSHYSAFVTPTNPGDFTKPDVPEHEGVTLDTLSQYVAFETSTDPEEFVKPGVPLGEGEVAPELPDVFEVAEREESLKPDLPEHEGYTLDTLSQYVAFETPTDPEEFVKPEVPLGEGEAAPELPDVFEVAEREESLKPELTIDELTREWYEDADADPAGLAGWDHRSAVRGATSVTGINPPPGSGAESQAAPPQPAPPPAAGGSTPTPEPQPTPTPPPPAAAAPPSSGGSGGGVYAELRVDTAALVGLGRSLTTVATEFSSAGENAAEAASHVAHSGLASAIRDFANNWSSRRDDIFDGLEFAARAATAIGEQIAAADAELKCAAVSFADGMSTGGY